MRHIVSRIAKVYLGEKTVAKCGDITLLHRWACLTYFYISDEKRDFHQTRSRYRHVRLAA